MKNNWLKAVNDINKEKYSIPEGWDTKEQVAEKLQCAPDRVADLLKPGIQSGEFERQEFSVWDETRRLTTRVTCYRIKPEGEPSAPSPKPTTDLERGRVERALKRRPDLPDRRIARNSRSTIPVVARIRKELGL